MTSLRLFFALWPDAAMQAALAEAVAPIVRQVSGAGREVRAVPSQNLHLTLAFLGTVPQGRVDMARQVAADCAETLRRRGSPIGFVFEGIEHWRKPEILCATAREASLPAVRLAQSLTDALTAHGFSPDLTKPFRPHVTVARKVAHPSRETGFPPVSWTFSEFALVQSRTAPGGSIYTVLSSYRFG
jgi:RNA 2',3'-cyclic 3'-phosphodiesterase